MGDALPISGSIDPKAFPFLLMDLHRQGATGSLNVDGPSYQKALYFRGGRILFGSSNDPRDQLGAILIENGKITPEQLDDVNAKVGPGNPLAKALADSGFVSQRELGEAARAKVERILSDVIAYTSGSFEFEDGVLPKGAVDLKLSTERLVLTSVRRVTDRNFVLRHLDSLEVVLAPRPDLVAQLSELQAEAGGLADKIDGRRSLKEAAGLTRLDDFEAAKVACALLFLGLVERRGGRSPGPAVSAGEAEIDLAQTAAMAFTPEPATLVPTPAAAAVPVAAPIPLSPPIEAEPFFISDAAAPPIPAEPATVIATPPPPPPAYDLAIPEAEPVTEIGLGGPREASAESSFEPPMVVEEPPPYEPPPFAPPPFEPPPFEPPPLAGPPASPAPVIALPAALPEPSPPPMAASRPSKDDLAALDALLGRRTIEGPLAPMERTPPRAEPRWEPRFTPGAAPRGRRAAARRRLHPLVIGLVVALAAGGGLAAWFYLDPLGRAGTKRAETPSRAPGRPSPATPASPVTVTTASPAASPSHEAAPSPGPTPPSPSPVATPPTPPPTRSPVSAGGPDARSLLERGELTQAARGFAAKLRGSKGAFSIQILVACSSDTVVKAVQNVSSPELYILPVSFKGRDCYRVCWGIYDSQGRAESAISTVPSYFRQGGATPKVVSSAGLLP
jgi:hypothetical protein